MEEQGRLARIAAIEKQIASLTAELSSLKKSNAADTTLEIVQLMNAGTSVKEIAALVNRSPASVRRTYERHLFQEGRRFRYEKAEAEDDGSLWALNLSVRTHNTLWRGNIRSIEALCEALKAPEYLLALRNFGSGALAEVQQAVSRYMSAADA